MMSPIERYLGLEATRGPVELLGLHDPDCTQSQVVEALRTRLARVGRHGQGNSVEADEVRLALHAAAAQLLDPRVRAHLLEPAPVTVVSEDPVSASERSNGAVGGISDEQLLAFRQNALALLRRSGGWNRQSMQYVAGLAHASGIPVGELSRALHGQVPPGRPAQPRELETGEGAASRRASRSRKKKSDPVMAIVGIVGGIGISMILALGLYSSMRQPEQQVTQTTVVDQGDASRDSALLPESGNSGQLSVDATNLLATITEAQSLLATDSGEAGWRFERAVSWLASNWHTLEADFLVVVDDSVRAFLVAAPERSAVWARAMEAVTASARAMLDASDGGFDVAGAAWSIQFLQSTRQNRGLPGRVIDESVAVLMPVFAGRIPRVNDVQGVRSQALRAVLERLLPERGVVTGEILGLVRAWEECVRTLGDRRAREGLRVEAIARMLRHGPSISQQRDARDASMLLLGGLSWGPPGLDGQVLPAVWALLAWFEDPLVPTAELSVVTQWLAHDTSGPRVSSNMILARAASESARAALRDRFAGMWAADVLDDDSPRNRWRAFAAEFLDKPMPGHAIGLAEEVARGGELQAAAYLVWSRQQERATSVMLGLREAREPTSAGAVLDDDRADRQWMVLYFSNSDSLKGRLDALRLLEDREGELTQGEADLLAELAFAGSPLEVRRRAQWIVRSRMKESQVLLGILEVLPEGRWRGDAIDLLEEIAGMPHSDPSDPQWKLSLRKGVIEKVLVALAREEPMGRVERSIGLLTRTLGDQLLSGGEQEDTERASATVLLDVVRQLRQEWEHEAQVYDPNPASPVSLDGLRQRRLGRSSLAHGPIQLFAVEQLSLAELLAFVLIAERPDATDRVQDVLDELFVARSRATSIFEQIASTQRAIVHLWWIRLGFGNTESFGLVFAGGVD